LTGTASGGIELYSPRNIQISDNRFWNLYEGIHTNCFDPESPNITIDGNVGQKIGTKLIECQGAGTENLRVTNNKVSDFTDVTDSTFGISVSIRREHSGAVISGNEISDVPSLTGGGAGVRIGIEAGGGSGMIVENNIVYGMVAAVTVDSTDGAVVRGNTLCYYTHPVAVNHPEWHGCAVFDSTNYDLSGQTDYSPNLPSDRAWTVAFDRFVTGGSGLTRSTLRPTAGSPTDWGIRRDRFPPPDHCRVGHHGGRDQWVMARPDRCPECGMLPGTLPGTLPADATATARARRLCIDLMTDVVQHRRQNLSGVEALFGEVARGLAVRRVLVIHGYQRIHCFLQRAERK
jgi:hypothetical protein